MRSRAVALTAAAVCAGLILLTGCTGPAPLPREPSDAEYDTALRRVLDHQWELTGLEGVVERPEFTAERPEVDDRWGLTLSACVADGGIDGWGYSEDGFTVGTGDRGTDEEQLILYSCYAQFPRVTALSRAQGQFIYDYYARTLIPCLGLHGYDVTLAPGRAQFLAQDARVEAFSVWSPYGALRNFPPTEAENTELVTACPPTVPGIDGWSYDATG